MAVPIEETLAHLKSQGFPAAVDCAVVLGTGLGRFADAIADPVVLPYADIPGFPIATVSGHSGRLIAGRIEGKRVLAFQGRAHCYETGDARIMRTPIAVAAAMKPRALILTNAAGSLNLEMRPGRVIVLRDHINFSGMNPLIGEHDDRRFVSLTDAYDETIRRRLKRASVAAGTVVGEGVYMWFSGPSFETPAEIKVAKLMGADLVGMSTVPEVILARMFRIPVGALSIVTNLAAGIEGAKPNHAETRDVAAAASVSLDKLLRRFIAEIDRAP
jgi:purine-nucleoside phosphorylase